MGRIDPMQSDLIKAGGDIGGISYPFATEAMAVMKASSLICQGLASSPGRASPPPGPLYHIPLVP
jgi:hypothetical protein